MKVLVLPGTTDLNRGDQTLLWESIRIVEDLYDTPQVYLYESGVNNEEKKLQKQQTEKKGYIFLERLLQHPRRVKKTNSVNFSFLTIILWGITAVSDYFRTSLLLSKIKLVNKVGEMFLSDKQKETYEIFKSIDVLFIKGGGFLHSYGKKTDVYLMYFFLFDIMLAQHLNKKVVILPNSIGPLKNKLAKKLAKKVLSKCDFIATRENVSHKFIEEYLHINNYLSPDLGFYQIASDKDFKEELENIGVDFSKKCVAVTLRPYRFDGSTNAIELYEKYISEISKMIDAITCQNIQVSLIAQTLGPSSHENDCLALEKVLEKVKNPQNVLYINNPLWDCQDIQKVYSYYDYLIGTRFHSVIFALNMHVPCIAIAYGGNKTFGIMEDIGIGNYVVSIENVSSDKILKLFNDLQQDCNYINKLNSYKERLNFERNNLLNKIKQMYD